MIIPPYLNSGDRVAVVATAKVVDKNHTLSGISKLKQWGLDVKLGKHLFEKHFQFAGTDAQRAEDLQQAINDTAIKAIFMVRGGYGSTRIIDQIDYRPLLLHPKWICGFSDITAFHLHLYRIGICSIHAPMPSFFYAIDDASLHWYHHLLFGKIMYCRWQGTHSICQANAVAGLPEATCHLFAIPSAPHRRLWLRATYCF
ncbi:MAG: LD-carboxypeptidase [Cyclobacteriaceae bacterium]|nr:LD-carboxypeptidase [Cyclobacteriaceae bacterium]